jgi:sugar phosphate isomerase/epimerase
VRALCAPERQGNKICAFIKFLQSLSYEQLAETIAKLGFDGIEATVRDRGHVLPERVEEDLPKLVEALRKHNLEITVMASSVNSVDQPHTEKVLRTAASLGVKRYRMAYYRYDLNRPVFEQLDEIRPVLKELVALNRELGISAVYQNHAGARYVGATLWDLYHLIKDYPVEDVGVAFDIRHATASAGVAWPVVFNLMRPHFGAVYVKDFRWSERKMENVPLGEGVVDEKFFSQLKRSQYSGPISLHVEYLQQAGLEPNVAGLKNDLATLRARLAAA